MLARPYSILFWLVRSRFQTSREASPSFADNAVQRVTFFVSASLEFSILSRIMKLEILERILESWSGLIETERGLSICQSKTKSFARLINRFTDNPYQLSRFVRKFRNLAAKEKRKKIVVPRALSTRIQRSSVCSANDFQSYTVPRVRTGGEWTIVSQFSYGNNGENVNERSLGCLAVFQTLSITEHRSRPVKLDEEDRGVSPLCPSPSHAPAVEFTQKPSGWLELFDF